MLPVCQSRGLLDPDHVVRQPQIVFNVLLCLVMPCNDPRAVRKRQDSAIGRKLMLELHEQPLSQILEVFRVGFANLPQQQALEARHPLAVVHTHLRQQPVALAAPARAAVADCRRPIRRITQPRRR